MVATPQSLHKFVNFCLQHIRKERGEAQVFLDRFFQAFERQGVLEAGAEYEVAVKEVNKVKQALPIWFGNPVC